MTKQTITVIGGSGAQGGGVVDALLGSGQYAVRVVSRDPAGASAEALKKRGAEREPRIAAANALYPAGFISFSEWAKVHLTPASVRG